MNKALLLTSAFLMTSCRDDANVFSIQLVQPTWSLLVSALNYFGYIISPDFYTNISKKKIGSGIRSERLPQHFTPKFCKNEQQSHFKL